MALWRITRTDDPKPGEVSSVVVCALTEKDAMNLACGGPSRDYPGVSFFNTLPMPGFPADRTQVKIEEEA